MAGRQTTHDPAVTRLVERQMRNWELGRSQRIAEGPGVEPEVADFITVSRSAGSGGDEVAAELGRRLGWPVFDREILDVMAGDDDVRRRIYASMDERDTGWLEEMLRALAQPGFTRNDYFHRLTETVLTLVRQGQAVFLGRGVDLILPRRLGLRVRLTAPLSVCVENLAKSLGIAPTEASAQLQRLEMEREGYIRQQFGPDAWKKGRFDLTVSLPRFGVPGTVELILAAQRLLSEPPT